LTLSIDGEGSEPNTPKIKLSNIKTPDLSHTCGLENPAMSDSGSPLEPDGAGRDHVHHFLMQSHDISIEAQFLIDSLPNAELTAVERVVRQLNAIRIILHSLTDEILTDQDIQDMVQTVDHLLEPLQQFIDQPPPSVSDNGVPRAHTGRPGRPAYKLDLERAILLHDLGISWKDVASALGVTRLTIYNHLDKAGLSAARREFTDISDGELDELVAEISIQHPFSGSTFVRGLLESQGVHLPRKRIQESLRRVDEIGVLLR
jgi:hypothetical protein